jgi:hypothetical protein
MENLSASRVHGLVGVALFVLALPPATLADSDQRERLDALFDNTPHASFEWVQAEGFSDRVAINVPVRLDSTEGVLQLDTGLDVTLLEGTLPEDGGWESGAGLYRCPRVEIGNIDLGPAWILNKPGDGTGGPRLGSLGLDVLVGHLVLIDYPGQRIAIMKHGTAPRWLLEQTSWAEAELRDGKFFLEVKLGAERVDDLFFDTGSSALDIAVDFEDWVNLTGCSGPEEAATNRQGNRWSSTVTIVGAPARGPLVVGSVSVGRPDVYYLAEQPTLFGDWPFPARGLIGNAPFWDKVVVMDLGVRQRFGIVR